MDQRREYEWKVSLAVWGGLGLALASLVTNLHQLDIHGAGRNIGTSLVVLAVLGHWSFLWFYVFRLNVSDKFEAIRWENEILKAMGGDPRTPVDHASGGSGAILFQMVYTALLAAAVVLALWAATASSTSV